jgi:hypothetical protein
VIDDHPELRDLGRDIQYHRVDPPRDRLLRALTSAIGWGVFLAVMAAAPCIVWLWRWVW